MLKHFLNFKCSLGAVSEHSHKNILGQTTAANSAALWNLKYPYKSVYQAYVFWSLMLQINTIANIMLRS